MALNEKVSEFTKETTFHGLKYVFSGETKIFRRLIWIFCVTAAMILFIYQVADRTFVYFDYNTTVSVNIRYLDKVPFPAVTVCNINTFRITKASRSGWYKCIEEIFNTKDWRLNSTVHCTVHNAASGGDLLYHMGHQLNRLIFRCTWKGSDCNMTEMFRPVWTEVGLCYTFNGSGQNLTISETGTTQGLKLTLNIEHEEYMAGPQTGTGAMVLLHDPTQEPQMKDLSVSVSPATHTKLAIEHSKVKNLGDPYDRCRHSAVAIATCLQRCNRVAAEKHCRCLSTLHGNVNLNVTQPPCDVLGELCILKFRDTLTLGTGSCGCDVPCERRIYDATISNSLLDMKKLEKDIQGEVQAEGLLSLFQDALEVSYQVDDDLTAHDDVMMESILQKGNLLNGSISAVRSTFTPASHSDVASQVVADLCRAVNSTIQEMYTVLEDKACEIEDSIQMLPSLSQFDTFVTKACGSYCLVNCEYGFPSLVLTEMKKCLNNEDRRTVMNDTSNAVVQESCDERFFNTSIDVIEPYVQTADCDVIETCVREIYTTRFGEFINPENDLLNLVEEFNKSYSEVMNDFTKLDPGSIDGNTLIPQCRNTMEAYKQLVTTFRNLQTILNQNLTSSHSETVVKAIDDYHSSLFGYKTVSDFYSQCYWFEPHLWWREGPELKCLPEELQTKTDKVVYSTEFKAFTDHIKDIEKTHCTEPLYLTDYETVTLIKPDAEADPWRHTMFCGRAEPGLPPFIIDLPHDEPNFEVRDEQWDITINDIDFKHITNPDDPRYKDIEKIHCFSYPITTGTLTTSAAKDMYEEYQTLAEEMMEYESNKPTGVKDVLDAYLLHHVNSKKSVLSEILLSERFTKIPSDLEYYYKRLEQNFQQAKLLYSNREIYNTLHSLIHLATQLKYIKIRDQDFQQIELLRRAMDLMNDNENVTRCSEDSYLCTVDGQNEQLTQPLKYLCYHTGDLLYNMTKNFKKAVKEYSKAYSGLSTELDEYYTKWDKLGQNYFQENFLNLDIYYKQLSVEEIIQQPAFEFLSLLSEVGGFLGLLLGASVLTVCEIFDFIVLSVMGLWSARKKKKKIENVDRKSSYTKKGDLY